MRMGRVFALVAGALVVCILGLLAAVYFSRDENNLQADNLLAERFTKQVTLAQMPEEELDGKVDLRVVAPFDWDSVLLVAQGTPRETLSRRLGSEWTGIAGVDSGDLLIFLKDGQVARFADYRGNARFANFSRPIAEIPRERAVFHVKDGVVTP